MNKKIIQIELSFEGFVWVGLSLIFIIAFLLRKIYIKMFFSKNGIEEKQMYERLGIVEKKVLGISNKLNGNDLV